MRTFVMIIMLVFGLKAHGKDMASNSTAKTEDSVDKLIKEEESHLKLIDMFTEKLAERVLKSPHLKELDNSVLGKPARQEYVHNTEALSPFPRLLVPTLPTKEIFTKGAQHVAIGGAAVVAGTAGVAETAATFAAATHVARTILGKGNKPVVGIPS